MQTSTANVDRPTLDQKLLEALAFLNQGQILSAENVLNDILKQTPSDTEALQLLGLVRRSQGFDKEAEEYFRKSLSLNDAQPNVHFNLANILKAAMRLDEAVASLHDAIRLKPNYAEAYLNLALVYMLMENYAEAEKQCRKALWVRPDFSMAKQLLGSVLNALNRPRESEQLLKSALKTAAPDIRQIAAYQHELGISLKMQRRFREALNYFDSAKSAVPDMPTVDYNVANTLQNLGNLHEAANAYRKAIARNPLDMNAHRDLNRLLYRLDNDDEFLKSYDQAASLFPQVGGLHIAKANFLFLTGNYQQARSSYEKAAQLTPDHVTPHDGLGMIYARMGEFDKAIAEHEIVLRMEPENAPAWRNFADTLLRAGDHQKARSAAEKAIAIQPNNQGAIALWTTALQLAADPLADRIFDFARFVRVYEISPPRGYSSIEVFNQELNTYLDRLHRDKRENVDQTLRHGSQTADNLFGAGHKIVELLREKIDEAVSDYANSLPYESDHPLLRRRRTNTEYSDSWSARLHSCGFHTNHVHPNGWVSSAYYVKIPGGMSGADPRAGCLKFGEPNFECGLTEPVRLAIQPQAGKLVLFPSYMWHGTVPFESTESRTSIAFDVIPKE